MQTLAVVLVLIAFVGAVISIINIIYPIKAIGFVNRKRAVLVFVLSFCLFAIGIITAGVSTSDNPQNGSLWLWILFAIAAYGLFRFTRRGPKKKKSARKSVPSRSVPDHEVRVRRQHASERKPGSTISPRATEGSEGSTETRGLRPFITDSPRVTKGPIRQARTARKSATRWIQPGDTATVAGRKIGGMIYLGSEPRRDRWEREGGPLIDPGLPVARIGSNYSGEGMPYWPSSLLSQKSYRTLLQSTVLIGERGIFHRVST